MGERRRGEEVGRREEYIWKGRRERKGRKQETYLEGWERGRSKGIHCEEGEKRKFKEVIEREGEGRKYGRERGKWRRRRRRRRGGRRRKRKLECGKEAKTLAVEGSFLAAMSKENRSSSPPSSNKRFVVLGGFSESFGWN